MILASARTQIADYLSALINVYTLLILVFIVIQLLFAVGLRPPYSRTMDVVLGFLRELAARNPVLVVLDDLQYAGQSTIEFVHYLGRNAGGSRLLVVATVRAENDAETSAALTAVASRVEVGPLGAAAAARGPGRPGGSGRPHPAADPRAHVVRGRGAPRAGPRRQWPP